MPIPDVVGDQQAKRRKARKKPAYRDPTPYGQLKRAKQITKKGAVKYRTPAKTGQRRIVKTAGGKTKVVSQKTAKRAFKKARRTEKARKRYAKSLGYGSLRAYARAEVAKPSKDKDLKVAGLNVSDVGSSVDRSLFPKGTNLRVVTAPYHVARATVEDPGKVAKQTVKGARDIIVGLPSAAVKSVTDPAGAFKDLSKDYTRRYGPLAKGDSRKFRERIKKEGAASELLDISGAAAIEGRVLGAGLKHRPVMAKPRPKLKTSGGKARSQTVSPNAFKAVGQRGLDKARAKNTARLVKRERAPALDKSLGTGEVAPLRRVRKQTRSVAKRKSRGVQALKGEQALEVHRGAVKNTAKLSKDETPAFKYAMQLGARTPEAAAAALSKRRVDIVKAREVEGTTIPKALAKTNDELPVIDRLLSAPEKAFTPKLAKVAEQERLRGERVAATDPGLAKKQRILRKTSPQAEHLGLKRAEGEPVLKFRNRVRVEAKKQGLEEPAYFKSAKRPTIKFSNFALGGTKAVAGDKKYTGALFRTGREDVRPTVHTDALAANIKRKHNWNTVADNFEQHAYGWGRNKPLSTLLDELDRKGIDPGDVAFWNPRKYKESRKNFGEPDEAAFGDDIAPPGIDKALDEAATDLKGLATKGEDFKNTSGWSVVPKAVYDEIHADTRPSGKVARSWDVAKAKQSRVLLGTNPPWEAFQIGSNALLTGLAKTGPIDAIKAQAWWRKLDAKQKAAVEPYVGVGPFRVDVAQPKLGASTNNRLVNGYRAFKDTPLMRRASKANPLDALFRVDNAQNNFFRRSVLYSQVKRDAYNRIGQNVGKAAEAEARLQGLFTLGPQDQIRAVLRNQDALEKHAGYVNDMLGDYATYTAKERRILGRSVMFYGFLRYSLHFTFHTMPVHHPVMTALIGNLSRLQTEEVRRVLGGDELPFALGRIYIKKDGKLQVVDLARLNPASNVAVETVSAKDIGKPLGVFPPIVGAALDIAYGKSAFKGKSLRVQGETGYGASEREATGQRIGAGDAGRVALERMLTLAYPYRVAKKVKARTVPQGDDSLLFDLRPTKYKRPDIVRSIRKRKADTDPGQLLREQLFPFLPRPTTDPEFAQSVRERRGEKKKARPKRGGGLWTGSGSGEKGKGGLWR